METSSCWFIYLGLAAIYTVSIPIFWWAPSRIMTLQNDMIAYAGALVVVLALLHGRERGYGMAQILPAGLGASFCCRKLSGPMVVGAIVFPLVVLNWSSQAMRLWWKSLRALVRRSSLGNRQLVILPILAGWSRYFISAWGAHDANAGEWFYLKNPMSLRYATGFLILYGYTLAGEVRYCVFAYAAKEAETTDVAAPVTKAWYEEKIPGFPRVDSEFWSNLPPPALVASNAPHGLWKEDGGNLLRIKANPPAVKAMNLGWPDTAGRGSGLTIYSSAHSWHLGDSSREQLVAHHSLTSLMTATSGMNTTWSAGGSGRTSTAVLEEGVSYLRLTAHENMNWMAIFRKVAASPERLPIVAEVRYQGRSGYAVAYGIGQSGSSEVTRRDVPAAGKWLRLSLPEKFDRPWTEGYFAIGLADVSSGDSIGIGTGAVIEGAVPRQKSLAESESNEPGVAH